MNQFVRFSVLGADIVKGLLAERGYQQNTEDKSWEKNVPKENMRNEAKWLLSRCLEYKVSVVERI